jgi:polysaccharide export outer membrane protein
MKNYFCALRRISVGLIVAILIAGYYPICEAQDSKPATKSMSASFVTSMDILNDTQKIGPGDELSFRVIEDEDPPRALKVTDSGEMEVPYVGRVKAAGKSCKTLAYEIKQALEKEYYIQASVILGVDTIAPKGIVSRGKVYITGAVRSQGFQEIPADEEFTVSKAVLRAGGLTEWANKRKVKLTRKDRRSGGSQTVEVDLADVLERGRIEKDVVVQPEDRIHVPEGFIKF